MTLPAPQIFLHGEEPEPRLPQSVAKGLPFQGVDSLADLAEHSPVAPSVLLLSRAMLPWVEGLPEYVVLPASHEEAAGAAEKANRLFMELTHLAPDGISGAIQRCRESLRGGGQR